MDTETEKLLTEVQELRKKADAIEKKALKLAKLPKIGYDGEKSYHTPTESTQKFFYDLGLADTDLDQYYKNIEWFKARKRIVDEIAKEKLKHPEEQACMFMCLNSDHVFSASFVPPGLRTRPVDMLFPHVSYGYLVDTLADDFYTYFDVKKGGCIE